MVWHQLSDSGCFVVLLLCNTFVPEKLIIFTWPDFMCPLCSGVCVCETECMLFGARPGSKDPTSGHKSKGVTLLMAWRREAEKEETLKESEGQMSVRPTLELCERQHCGKTGWSTYGLSQACRVLGAWIAC